MICSPKDHLNDMEIRCGSRGKEQCGYAVPTCVNYVPLMKGSKTN